MSKTKPQPTPPGTTPGGYRSTESSSSGKGANLHGYVRPLPGEYGPAVPQASPIGLNESDFRKIAERGFGDGLNSYAHTMAWFQDQLFVGTTRANLALVRVVNPNGLRVWPVEIPEDIYDLDLKASIWRYSPHSLRWQQVYVSPMVPGTKGKSVPRDIGYRGMVVFQGRSDPIPALYAANWAAARAGMAPVILRSLDGEAFEEFMQPRMDTSILSYRSLLSHNGSLFTSPTGKLQMTMNMSDLPAVLESQDPTSEAWQAVSQLGFGDENNTSVFEMQVFNGHLYAGTLNPKEGLQVWKAKPDGKRPYSWKKILDAGAYRGNLNEGAASLTVFAGALYVGTGIQGGGYDRVFQVGPAAAELLRIYPDDSWDLLIGQARSTPDGYKSPLSGLGPGFNNFFNGYLWRMAVHEGWLYAGTYNWAVYLPYLHVQRWPAWLRQMVSSIGPDNMVERYGGFELWKSQDGVHWLPVTQNGFGNPYNVGARTLVSTPSGLFVGTANPFGPKVAAKTAKGYVYVPNDYGGLEVWHGKTSTKAVQPKSDQIELHRSLASQPTISRPADGNTNQLYDTQMFSELADQYYGGSDFYNFGFWLPDTRSQREASENLVEELLSFLPLKRGRILDVACGKGATTEYLLKYFPPENVVGINISAKQLERCQQNAPGCTFLEMNATDLRFHSEAFEHVICVEAAFHFNTRQKFIREAWRVLKPGGYLVLSDILTTRWMDRLNSNRHLENYVGNLQEYQALFTQAGFDQVRVVDATFECYEGFRGHFRKFLFNKRRSGELDEDVYRRMMVGSHYFELGVRYYVLAGARKAGGGPSL
jgi:cyclopropane fatty-acyl-phospholipid synthase-like methyltransferase